MNWKTLSAAMVLGACVAGGCQDKHHDEHKDAAEHESREEMTTFAAIPAKVRDAFNQAYPGATVTKVEKEVYKDGTVHYELEFTDKAGKKMEKEFNSEGSELD